MASAWLLLLQALFFIIIPTGLCDVWCYQCSSTQPGCGETIDWWIHHSITCPGVDDKCVKIVEKKGVQVTYIRDCLSTIEGKRKDIPADRFEGCRPAALDIRLGESVENHYLQGWLHQYEEVFYCFCSLDYWCNGATVGSISFTVLLLNFILVVVNFVQFS